MTVSRRNLLPTLAPDHSPTLAEGSTAIEQSAPARPHLPIVCPEPHQPRSIPALAKLPASSPSSILWWQPFLQTWRRHRMVRLRVATSARARRKKRRSEFVRIWQARSDRRRVLDPAGRLSRYLLPAQTLLQWRNHSQ